MREINALEITSAVERLCIEANCYLPEDVKRALENAAQTEESPLGKEILADILKNEALARANTAPICQDTGLAVFFVELGQDVHITGGGFDEAFNEGVRLGYEKGFLRKSTVDNPLIGRKNRGDNTPAIIHTSIVPGESVKITIAPKGGGSENMSTLCMLTPSAGIEGVKKFVVETVDKAGSNPCPPIIVGVGVGGTFEMTALLAKKSLLRTVGEHNPNPDVAQIEKELLEEINTLGIGPQGFGGTTTALAVHIETFPSHIAGMPVAVNLQCHVARHREVIL